MVDLKTPAWPTAVLKRSYPYPVYSARAATFRTALASVLLADVVHLCLNLRLFPKLVAMQGAMPVFVVWLVALGCMIAGYRPKISCTTSYICCALMLGGFAPKKGFDQAAGDSIAIGLSLLAAAFAHWPTLSPQPILAIFLSSVYVDSGIQKLISPMWRAGLGVAAPMGLPSLIWMNTSWLSFFPAALLRGLGWSVIGFELCFPLFYLWKRTRLMTLLFGIALHLGIAVIYPIPIFSGLMVVAYLALLPEKWYELLPWLRGRESITARWCPAFTVISVVWVLSIANIYAAQAVPYSGLRFCLKAVRKVFFVTAGIAPHGVFADGLFRHYGYQIRLTATDPDSLPEPYSRGNLLAWSVRDRTWENWWKKTQAPWVRLTQAEQQLVIWADACWHPSTDPVLIQIEARPQKVELQSIDTSLFSVNNAVPWQRIGTIRLTKSSRGELSWDRPVRPDEKVLGDYITRILTQNTVHMPGW